MKKYIQSMMAIAAIVSFASCSSEDNNTTIENESATKVMTFTAKQEDNEASTKATLSGTYINWESEDKISIFDGTNNNQFTLTGGAESTSGKFTGEAGQSTSYTAVYPYQSNASYSGGVVTNVTLPATQTATDNSFDKNAALMMAQSNSTTLNFKNAVSLVKVTPKFACTKIELEAAEGSSDILAGKGTLNWNNGEPTINFTEETSKTITLKGSIAKDNSYYIVVPTGTLNRMWKITFTADDGKKYTRYCSKLLTIERNKIINLGVFETSSLFWADEHRGNKVTYEQEVDLGLTITGTDSKQYRVIFANANLTTTGLATNEYDYGDYFAWGAKTVWYSAINKNTDPWSITTLDVKSGGYLEANAPFYDSSTSTYTEYANEGNTLKESDDAARQILGGEWQLPTKDIWVKLTDTNNYKWEWTTQDGYNGYKVTSNTVNTKSIFLPAAGKVKGTLFDYVGRYGSYWSGTAYSSTHAYYLKFSYSSSYSYFYAQNIYERYCGLSVRPVRLVAVPQ